MCRIGLCVFCSLKFSVAMCMLLVKKLESVWFLTTKSGSLRNSVQKCGGKILRGEKIISPPWWFQRCGGERRSAASAVTRWLSPSIYRTTRSVWTSHARDEWRAQRSLATRRPPRYHCNSTNIPVEPSLSAPFAASLHPSFHFVGIARNNLWS